MKKILSQLLILTILLGVFSPVFVGAQVVDGGINDTFASNNINPDADVECSLTHWGQCVMNGMADIVTYLLNNIILRIASWILYIAGTLLDFVLRYTIIDLKVHLDELTGINITWKVIRDLMNMAFIFILVYKGIELIIGVGSKESIKKFLSTLILAALLVNFSLFFTKILIDVSNIVTIGFYKAIIQSANQPIPVTDTTGQQFVPLSGISTPFMTNLGLASFWARGNFDVARNAAGGNANMMLIPLLGSVLFIVTAFVFVAISFIFIIRYITLVILLILSPVAYMGSALPGFGSSSKDWWDTLTGQLTFGPVYMIMTWVVLQLMSTSRFIINQDAFGQLVSGGMGQQGVPYEQSSISFIFNFVILIGLIIASLTVAKSTASKGSKFVGKATKNFTSFAGNQVFGGASRIGRFAIGGTANAALGSERMKNLLYLKNSDGTLKRDEDGNLIAKSGVSGWASKSVIKATNRTAQSSFDTRSTKVFGMLAKNTDMDYGKGADREKVNYQKDLEAKADAEAKFAKLLKPSDAAMRDREAVQKELDKQKERAEYELKSNEQNIKDLKEREKQLRDRVNKVGYDERERIKNEIDEIEKNIKEKEANIGNLKAAVKRESDAASKNKKEMESVFSDRVNAYAKSVEEGGIIYRYGSTMAKITAGAVAGNLMAGPLGGIAGAYYGISNSNPVTKENNMAIAKKIRGVLNEKKKVNKKNLEEIFDVKFDEDGENKEAKKEEKVEENNGEEVKTT